MKVHKQGQKANVVMDWEDFIGIAIVLSESPVLKNKMLALKIKQAMEDFNKRSEGK
jgi:hypothetical protein